MFLSVCFNSQNSLHTIDRRPRKKHVRPISYAFSYALGLRFRARAHHQSCDLNDNPWFWPHEEVLKLLLIQTASKKLA